MPPSYEPQAEQSAPDVMLLKCIDRSHGCPDSDVSAWVAWLLMRARGCSFRAAREGKKRGRLEFGAPQIACAKHSAETLALKGEIQALARLTRETMAEIV